MDVPQGNIKQGRQKDPDFLKLEYETVLAEQQEQLRTRNATTVLVLTVGIAALGYAIQNGAGQALFLVFPLLVFLALYTNYVYRRLLALKADAYIRVYIHPELPELRWHARKSHYPIGLIYYLQYVLVSAVFMSLILINLYYIIARVAPLPAGVLTVFAAVITTLVTFDNLRDPYPGFIAQWEDRRAKELEEAPVLRK